MNSLVTFYGIASATTNWLSAMVSQEVEFNTSCPVRTHSSPPIKSLNAESGTDETETKIPTLHKFKRLKEMTPEYNKKKRISVLEKK